jgi:hypothetical protein
MTKLFEVKHRRERGTPLALAETHPPFPAVQAGEKGEHHPPLCSRAPLRDSHPLSSLAGIAGLLWKLHCQFETLQHSYPALQVLGNCRSEVLHRPLYLVQSWAFLPTHPTSFGSRVSMVSPGEAFVLTKPLLSSHQSQLSCSCSVSKDQLMTSVAPSQTSLNPEGNSESKASGEAIVAASRQQSPIELPLFSHVDYAFRIELHLAVVLQHLLCLQQRLQFSFLLIE